METVLVRFDAPNTTTGKQSANIDRASLDQLVEIVTECGGTHEIIEGDHFRRHILTQADPARPAYSWSEWIGGDDE